MLIQKKNLHPEKKYIFPHKKFWKELNLRITQKIQCGSKTHFELNYLGKRIQRDSTEADLEGNSYPSIFLVID